MRHMVLGASMLLVACTTSLQDIREQEPVARGDFPQPYQALAQCVFEQLDALTGRSGWDPLANFIYRLNEQAAPQRARVNAISTGGLGPPQAILELTVDALAPSQARVEFRSRWDMLQSTEQRVWAMVTTCGQSG